MNKVTYWMRKLGILRTSSYKVSGDAQKLNEINASDGGMIQSQKEIDEQYEKSKKNQQGNITPPEGGDNKKGGGKVVFWVFLVIAIISCLLLLLYGFSIWLIIAIGLWAWFLKSMWSNIAMGTFVAGKSIIIGIILLVTSFIFVGFVVPDTEEIDKYIQKTDTKESKKSEKAAVVEMDAIGKFLVDLKAATGIKFGEVADDPDATWTTQNINVGPTDAKTITGSKLSSSEWAKVNKYFTDLGAGYGTIGFTFVNKSANTQEGYIVDNAGYTSLMCVITNSDEKSSVSCGWGPGGGVK